MLSFRIPGTPVISVVRSQRLVALASFCIATSAACASAPDIAGLQRQIDALNERVQHLEQELSMGVAINPARKVQPQPGGWRTPENWKLLAAGMEVAEVLRILGEPERTKTISKFEIWYYGDGLVRLYLNRLKSFEAP